MCLFGFVCERERYESICVHESLHRMRTKVIELNFREDKKRLSVVPFALGQWKETLVNSDVVQDSLTGIQLSSPDY